MIRLDIFADPVCPWCFLGKANLNRALEAHPDHPFQIEWHPYELNPDMPVEGVEKKAYLAARFGGSGKLDQIHDRFRQIAAEAGVTMDPDTPTRIPNTRNAHRVIHWAGLEGRQTPVVSALFRAYWIEGRDIGQPEVLVQVAGEAGMDPVVVARLLASDADVDTVEAREAHARERGVTAVPTFVIADRYVVSGAQPPKLWGQVIEDLLAQANDAAAD